MEKSDHNANFSGIENSTQGIKEALKEALRSFGPDADPLIRRVEETEDRQKLFLMWQIMREAYLKLMCNKTAAPVLVKKKDGTTVVAKNYDEVIAVLAQ